MTALPQEPPPTMPAQAPDSLAFEPCERVDLLSVGLLDENRALVNELRRLARTLHLELGWHYPLDLTWIIRQLGPVSGKHIMDAGAGVGILQWYLAGQGAQVTSVDRDSRANLPLGLRAHYQVQGLREADLMSPGQVIWKYMARKTSAPFYRRWASKAYYLLRSAGNLTRHPQGPGHVLIYNQDLANLADISDNSLDAVVSLSALEHNQPQGLERVVKEILRVLKPGGVLLATLTAARDQDYWHKPSSGMCYTDTTLRRIFDLPADSPSNYDCYDELFAGLTGCAELHDNLASFYFKSDKNGMPWGKWDPQYMSVGVCKIKRV